LHSAITTEHSHSRFAHTPHPNPFRDLLRSSQFGDFGSATQQAPVPLAPAPAPLAPVSQPPTDEDEFGDFGSSPPAPAPAPVAAPGPQKTTVDDVFGSFDSAVSAPMPTMPVPTMPPPLPPASSYADDFGDFGSATPAASLAEPDDDGDFGNFSSASTPTPATSVSTPARDPASTVIELGLASREKEGGINISMLISTPPPNAPKAAPPAPPPASPAPAVVEEADEDEDFGDFGGADMNTANAAEEAIKGGEVKTEEIKEEPKAAASDDPFSFLGSPAPVGPITLAPPSPDKGRDGELDAAFVKSCEVKDLVPILVKCELFEFASAAASLDSVEGKISELEMKKREAAMDDDFDTAKELKNEIVHIKESLPSDEDVKTWRQVVLGKKYETLSSMQEVRWSKLSTTASISEARRSEGCSEGWSEATANALYRLPI